MKGSTDIQVLVRNFTVRLVAAVEADAAERVHSAVASAFGLPASPGSTYAFRPPSQAGPAPKARRRIPSAKTLAVRRLQGQYLGALRRLQPAGRARVKKEARDKGVAGAVKLAVSFR
jgi:hypothetical protein